jgi:DNA-binding MarR family transcriptional regulator
LKIFTTNAIAYPAYRPHYASIDFRSVAHVQNKTPYSRFLSLLQVLSKGSPAAALEKHAALLAFIYEESASGKTTRFTDLVQEINFGTGPTVLKKVNELKANGLITVKKSSDDSRVKLISLTREGVKHLEAREVLMLSLDKST